MKKLKITLGLIALATAAHANAACMDSLNPLLHSGSAAASAVKVAPGFSQLTAASRYPQAGPAAHVVPVADWGNQPPSIVGLWQFQLAGFQVDWGTQAWHADGTEFMFSGGQDPATGDVCQGVWQQVGQRTYTLNHIAMGWAALGADPAKGGLFPRIHFHMVVTLDPRGQTFSGKYSVAVWMESASDPFDEDSRSNPPVASGTGTVTATRVNPDE